MQHKNKYKKKQICKALSKYHGPNLVNMQSAELNPFFTPIFEFHLDLSAELVLPDCVHFHIIWYHWFFIFWNFFVPWQHFTNQIFVTYTLLKLFWLWIWCLNLCFVAIFYFWQKNVKFWLLKHISNTSLNGKTKKVQKNKTDRNKLSSFNLKVCFTNDYNFHWKLLIHGIHS